MLWAISLATAVGLYLQWPSLYGGFRSDDYVQWAMLRGSFPAQRSVLDLFDFASGTPDEYRRLVDFGHLPWWSAPELRLRMWRPLASLLIAFDFRAFGIEPFWHHVHSLLWFVLLLWAAGGLLLRLLPTRVAALALCIFASSPCHVLPVGWIANRSTLLATGFGFLAVALHSRWERQRLSWANVLGTVLAASVALLSGEYAVTALVYGLIRLRDGRRWRDCWPILAPLVGYMILHSVVGSDIIGSGYYLSPLREPVAFGKALLTRVPALVADLLFGVPSAYFSGLPPLRNDILSWGIIPPEIWFKLPDWRTLHIAIGYLAVVAGAVLVRWLARDASRELRALAIGAACALVPVAGSLPEDRLLVAATLGSSALIASALTAAWSNLRNALTRRAQLSAAVLAALLLWVPARGAWRSYHSARNMIEGGALARAWSRSAQLPGSADANARVYLLTTPDFNSAVNLPWQRLMENRPLPRSYRRLCPGALPVDVTRSSDRELEVRVLTNDMRGTALPSLYRTESAALHAGDTFQLPGLRVEVLDVYDDNPSHLRFSFDRSVDDPNLWFLVTTEHGLEHARMPALGETIRLVYAFVRDLRTSQGAGSHP